MALALILASLGALSLLLKPLSPGGPLQLGDGDGPMGFAVFLGIYVACTLAAVPRNVLSTAAGAMFGLAWGLPLAYLGSLLGATLAFLLARLLGREAFGNLSGSRGAAFDDLMVRRGAWTVLAARLTPVVPFTAFNYLAGVTGLTWRTYLWGTIVGIVPGTILYVSIGGYALAPGSWSTELLSGLLLLTVAYLLWRAWARKNGHTQSA